MGSPWSTHLFALGASVQQTWEPGMAEDTGEYLVPPWDCFNPVLQRPHTNHLGTSLKKAASDSGGLEWGLRVCIRTSSR